MPPGVGATTAGALNVFPASLQTWIMIRELFWPDAGSQLVLPVKWVMRTYTWPLVSEAIVGSQSSPPQYPSRWTGAVAARAAAGAANAASAVAAANAASRVTSFRIAVRAPQRSPELRN